MLTNFVSLGLPCEFTWLWRALRQLGIDLQCHRWWFHACLQVPVEKNRTKDCARGCRITRWWVTLKILFRGHPFSNYPKDFWPPPPVLRIYYSKAWPPLLNELLKSLTSLQKKISKMSRVFVHFVYPTTLHIQLGVPKNCVACMKVRTEVYFISPYVYGLLSVKYIILLVNAVENVKKCPCSMNVFWVIMQMPDPPSYLLRIITHF